MSQEDYYCTQAKALKTSVSQLTSWLSRETNKHEDLSDLVRASAVRLARVLQETGSVYVKVSITHTPEGLDAYVDEDALLDADDELTSLGGAFIDSMSEAYDIVRHGQAYKERNALLKKDTSIAETMLSVSCIFVRLILAQPGPRVLTFVAERDVMLDDIFEVTIDDVYVTAIKKRGRA